MKYAYIDKVLSAKTIDVINQANDIIDEYLGKGFTLTLRQLYYQFVARGLIANKQSEYKRLGSIVNDARLVGLMDWYAIEDRTRFVRGLSHWDSPAEILKGAANQYRIDKWVDQDFHIEVWIEKDALVGVIQGVCDSNDVSYFSCRGYISQSELWRAARRALAYEDDGKTPVIIHLGDHDPSGIDMSRDIEDRFNMFESYGVIVERIALNFDQVEQFNPPPNPTKLTDSRARGYVEDYGRQSWELDALDPDYIVQIIQNKIDEYRDDDRWDIAMDRENAEKEKLKQVADNWDTIELEEK